MRILKNQAERAFQQYAEKQGLEITKRGWPDFFCLDKSGKPIVVEVKKNGTSSVKRSQQQILQTLASFGIDCYIWAPDSGLVEIRKYPGK